MFLLDANEFYPFGVYVNLKNEITPVGVSSENEFPRSIELIDQLERYYSQLEFLVGVIVNDVLLKQNGIEKNAIELRIWDKRKAVTNKYFNYEIGSNAIVFDEIL